MATPDIEFDLDDIFGDNGDDDSSPTTLTTALPVAATASLTHGSIAQITVRPDSLIAKALQAQNRSNTFLAIILAYQPGQPLIQFRYYDNSLPSNSQSEPMIAISLKDVTNMSLLLQLEHVTPSTLSYTSQQERITAATKHRESQKNRLLNHTASEFGQHLILHISRHHPDVTWYNDYIIMSNGHAAIAAPYGAENVSKWDSNAKKPLPVTNPREVSHVVNIVNQFTQKYQASKSQ